MKNSSFTKYESETIINYNDDEQDATLYTCNKSLIKKMDMLVKKFPDIYKIKRQDKYSKTYLFTKKLVAIKSPRNISKELKKKMSERGRLSMAKLKKIAG